MMLGDNVFYAVRFYVYCTLYINITLLHCDKTYAHHCGLGEQALRSPRKWPDLTFLRVTVCFLEVMNDRNDGGRMDVVVCVGYTSVTWQ